MRLKISDILKIVKQRAIEKYEIMSPTDGSFKNWFFVCLNIEKVENGKAAGYVESKALIFFESLKEEGAFDVDKNEGQASCGGGWWPRDDIRRIGALEIAITRAEELEKE